MIKSREKNSNTRQASRLFYVDGCIIDQRTALKDNRGRAPVRLHIEGFCNAVLLDEPGEDPKRPWDRSVAWFFRRWGRFHLKWRFPLFLHPSPLYPTEWVTHDNRNIHAACACLLPLRRLYAADGAVQTWLSAVDLLLADELRDLSAAARTASAHRLHLNQTAFGLRLSSGNRPRFMV